MYSLFLNTTQKYCHIAIFNKDKVIKHFKVETNNNLTDIVVEHIDNLIKKCKLTYNDIDSFYLLNGPGSFTGTRVNVLIAKTWWLTKKTKTFVLDSLSFQIPSVSGISVLDARGGNWYIYAIKNNKVIVKHQMIDTFTLDKLVKKYKEVKVYKCFDNVDVFKNLIFHLKDFKQITNLNSLEPFYIKKAI